MGTSKLHHQIPIIGRPFLQRNETRRQRDQALFERDEARRKREEAERELADARRDRDAARKEQGETPRRPRFCVELIANNCAVGWVFADSGPITRVIARRNGQIIAETSSFLLRSDVAAAYPNSKDAERSGFQLSFEDQKGLTLSTVSILAEEGGTEFLIGECLTTNVRALEEQFIEREHEFIIEREHEFRSPYPADIGKWYNIVFGTYPLKIDGVCDILRTNDLMRLHPISDYRRYMSSCWSHFNFVERSFPLTNRSSNLGRKDYLCKANSPIEMMSIAHHLYVANSYGIKGAFAEFGCFKGFSSSMLSYACSLLGIDMHIYDSFEGLPSSGPLYHQKGDFSANLEEVLRNITQFCAIKSVVFHKGFFAETLKREMPPPLICLWMDVDLDRSARDVVAAATMLSPAGAIFSHECLATDFSGCMPRSDLGGPDAVIPAILSYYQSEATIPKGFFVGGNTGAFWRDDEGIPVLPTNDLQRLLQVIQP